MSNHGIFIRKIDLGIILLFLYIDDMIITTNNDIGISELKRSINQYFEMKDLGNLNYLLCIEILLDSVVYYLSQAKYTYTIIAQVGLTDCKTAHTPLETNLKLTPLYGTSLSNVNLYR